jgi:HK97 family phage portal protein
MWNPLRPRPPEDKASRTGAIMALTGAGRPRWTPRDYAHLASEGFGRNAVAYRCVRMVAEAAASTPLAVFRDGARAATDDPVVRLLDKPNAEQSGVEFLEGLHAQLQTAGNAYVEAVGEETPEELWALRPDRMKVVPGRGGWAAAWEYSVDGRSVRIARPADGWPPVMHLKLFHPTDDHYGF